MSYPCLTEGQGEMHSRMVNVSRCLDPSAFFFFFFNFVTTLHSLQKNDYPRALIVKANMCGSLALLLAAAKSNPVAHTAGYTIGKQPRGGREGMRIHLFLMPPILPAGETSLGITPCWPFHHSRGFPHDLQEASGFYLCLYFVSASSSAYISQHNLWASSSESSSSYFRQNRSNLALLVELKSTLLPLCPSLERWKDNVCLAAVSCPYSTFSQHPATLPFLTAASTDCELFKAEFIVHRCDPQRWS